MQFSSDRYMMRMIEREKKRAIEVCTMHILFDCGVSIYPLTFTIVLPFFEFQPFKMPQRSLFRPQKLKLIYSKYSIIQMNRIEMKTIIYEM